MQGIKLYLKWTWRLSKNYCQLVWPSTKINRTIEEALLCWRFKVQKTFSLHLQNVVAIIIIIMATLKSQVKKQASYFSQPQTAIRLYDINISFSYIRLITNSLWHLGVCNIHNHPIAMILNMNIYFQSKWTLLRILPICLRE